jgi:hypothetical protein
VRDVAEIERAVTAFARESNGGLIVTASAAQAVHHKLIVTLAVQHRLPPSTPSATWPPTAAWHFCDIARSRMDFRFRWKSGHAAAGLA